MNSGFCLPDLLSMPFKKSANVLGTNLLEWYLENRQEYPWRYKISRPDPYRVWLSEIMLQQTLIKVVLPAYKNFLVRFPTVAHLANASEEEVKQACSGLGYYRRFGLLHRAAQFLNSKAEKGQIPWPTSYEEWLALPGVGPYTASAVSSIVLGSPNAVVDGNVERVLCRLLDIRLPPNLPSLKKVFNQRAAELLVKDNPGDYNQAIMELGQRVCTLTKPVCQDCPLRNGCLSFERSSQALAPQKKLKKEYVNIQLNMQIPVKRDKIGLLKRSDKARFLKDTLGFPTYIPNDRGIATLDGGSSNIKTQSKTLGNFKHTITHHKMSVDVSSTDIVEARKFIWVDIEEVSSRLTSSLDAKCWKIYQIAGR